MYLLDSFSEIPRYVTKKIERVSRDNIINKLLAFVMHIFVLMHCYTMLFISLITVVKLLLLFHEIKQKWKLEKRKIHCLLRTCNIYLIQCLYIYKLYLLCSNSSFISSLHCLLPQIPLSVSDHGNPNLSSSHHLPHTFHHWYLPTTIVLLASNNLYYCRAQSTGAREYCWRSHSLSSRGKKMTAK